MITEKEYKHTGPNLTPIKTFVVPLKTIIKDQNLLPKVNDLVIRLNSLVKTSYQFIRCYVLYCYKNNFSYEINEEFIKQCISILCINNPRKPYSNQRLLSQITWVYNNEFQPIFNHVKVNQEHFSNFITDIINEINTSINNNIQEHFIQHFLRFINKTTEKITKDKTILHQFKHELLNFNGNNNPIFNDWKTTHIPSILRFQINPVKLKSIYYDVKVNTLNYLNGMIYMNTILESLGYKLFEPIPQRTSDVPRQILMCNTSFVNYFYPTGGKSELKKSKNKHFCWNNFLDFNHKVFKSKNYKFSYKIRTDGISCGLIFIREDLVEEKRGSFIIKNINKKEALKEFKKLEDMTDQELKYNLENVNIVGCDPGKSNLVSMVDSNGNKLSYTSVQRRFEIKLPKCKKILEKEKDRHGINQIEVPLSTINLKTANYDNYKNSLKVKNYVDQQTKPFY